MGFSRQEYWSGLPFPSPVEHIVSELSTMTCLSWMALYNMAYSFIELDKAVVHVIRLVTFCDCGFQCLPYWWRRIRGLWKFPDEIDWLRGILGLVLMGGAMLNKSLIQFSVDGWSCVLSLLFIWGQTMVEVMKIMLTSLKRSQACTATVSAPNPAAGHHRPTPKMLTFTLAIFCLITSNLPWFMDLTFQVIMQYCSLQQQALLPPPVHPQLSAKTIPRHPPETPRHPQARLLWGSLFLFPGCTRFCCALQESISQSYVSSGLNANSPILPSCWTSPLPLDVGYLLTASPAQRSCCSLPWMRGISSPLSLLTLNME